MTMRHTAIPISISLLLIVCLVADAQEQESTVDPTILLQQAEQAMDEHRFEDALSAYHNLIVAKPTIDAPAYVAVGDCLTQLGRFGEARVVYAVAAEKYPMGAGRLRVVLKLGDALAASGDIEQARQAYQRARVDYNLNFDIDSRLVTMAADRPDVPQDKSYRFIWLIPTDVSLDDFTVKRIDESVAIVQRWFLSQMGKTFRANPAEVIRGVQPRQWYTDTGNDAEWNTIHNAVDEVFRKCGTFRGDTSHPYRYVVYVSSDGAGGANGVPYFVGLPLADVVGVLSAKWDTRWAGGLAHEIGHTLCLTHEEPDTKEVMRYGYLDIKTTYLSKANIDLVLNAPRNTGWLIDAMERTR